MGGNHRAHTLDWRSFVSSLLHAAHTEGGADRGWPPYELAAADDGQRDL